MLTYPFFEWYFTKFMETPGRYISIIIVTWIISRLLLKKGNALDFVLYVSILPILLYLFLWVCKEIQKVKLFAWIGVVLRVTVDVCVLATIVIGIVYLTKPLWKRFKK